MIRLTDPFMWAFCWLAYLADMVLPLHRLGGRNPLARLAWWLLPFAGYYAYHEPDSCTSWRWSERVRR